MSRAIHVLYHGHCADGFGAALVAWMVFQDAATYTAVNYGEALPAIDDGAAVYILDFSYPREVLEQLAARCEVRVLDHHATAEEALAGLPFAKFEKEKSGAVMSWEWFRDSHPETVAGAVPELLLHLQDRDLWRFELAGTKQIHAALMSRPRTFPEWASLVGRGRVGIAHLFGEGRTVLRCHEAMVESIVARAHFSTVEGPVCDYQVPMANTPVLQSECCHRLLELYPDVPFVVAYFHQARPGGQTAPDEMAVWRMRTIYSLRSRAPFDCAELAQWHGGGGHARAAGFEVDFDHGV